MFYVGLSNQLTGIVTRQDKGLAPIDTVLEDEEVLLSWGRNKTHRYRTLFATWYPE